MQTTISKHNRWDEAAKGYTMPLVRIKSISPSADETRVAEAVLALRKEDGFASYKIAIPAETLQIGKDAGWSLALGQ